MSEEFNIKFVKEVEKHPCLYDTTLVEYSQRFPAETAWNAVAEATNMSISESKEKWRNLRTAFTRRQKSFAMTNDFDARGHRKTKRPYYLYKAMKFVVPHIKSLQNTPGSNNDTQSSTDELDNEEETPIYIDDFPIKEEPILQTEAVSCNSPFPSNDTRKSKPEIEEEVQREDRHRKRHRSFSSERREYTRGDQDEDPKKMFLLSLINDVSDLTNVEMRLFKRKTIELIDDIISTRSSK